MQEEISQDFLVKLAREYGLTSLEEEAFVETFSSEITDQVIIKNLNISLSAYKARMGNVYVKFSFREGGRGKKERLRYFLQEQYHRENPNHPSRLSDIDTDAFVNELNERLREKIRNECSTMRVLDMTSPLELSSIFTEINVLEQVSRHRRLRIDDLLRDFQAKNDGNSLDRFGLNRRIVKKISGIDYVQQQEKLLVIGKPGAGKTTFLKHIAIQCSERKLFPDHLPIFVVLKDFAEKNGSPSLLEYLIQDHDSWKVHGYEIEYLLKERRVLLLLDGLDEVRIEDLHRVNQQIQSFTENFHGNRFILTCRVAAQEYVFEQFTEVEVADFNEQQIQEFANHWFTHKQTPDKAARFLEKLQRNPRIQELATNPLLLTLLCLVFEEEADFPDSRAELYEEGINTLLRRWDASRNIERGQLYQELSVARKVGMLSHIALQAFEQSAIFFRKQTLADYIANYIVNLPGKRNRKLLPYEMERQGEIVLKSIEAQHGLFVERAYGIYSFSHLSFQEYFAAKAIASEYELERLQTVFEQVRNKQWNEVFLLAVNTGLFHSKNGLEGI
ncbi:putative NTPase NACHT family protein [Halomicronema hongdechloris C2206]|uniref:NTPase NACHT family protein n=1 Tax=Halomicronema hongdechloris C2206 TaxID=1641165 RepID=A0A1Z3HS74_9CYAN|nr:NACHT domain-containing protein [Halomicronema hongdechloris]ASC72977.1 putative NTPase NACHT family protein [Halomicronema hongdechloris C2206]